MKRVRDTPVEDAIEEIKQKELVGDALYWVFGNDGLRWTNWMHRVIQPRFGFDMSGDYVMMEYHMLATAYLMRPSGVESPRRFKYCRDTETMKMVIMGNDGVTRSHYKATPDDTPVWTPEKVGPILEHLMDPLTAQSTEFIRALLAVTIAKIKPTYKMRSILALIDHAMTLEAAGYTNMKLSRPMPEEDGAEPKYVKCGYTLEFGKYTLAYKTHQGLVLLIDEPYVPLVLWKNPEDADVVTTIRRYEQDIPSLKLLLTKIRNAYDHTEPYSPEVLKSWSWRGWEDTTTKITWYTCEGEAGHLSTDDCYLHTEVANSGYKHMSIVFKDHKWGPYMTYTSYHVYRNIESLFKSIGIEI